MGCVSTSDSFEPQQFDNKIMVWFLGGGPGSPKQQVAQFLISKYKFKYLSVMELIRFEETAGSPESAEIRKVMEEKGDFSCSLILRVLQKVLVLYGPRKYLIDNFPRTLADALEFEALCKKHPQLQFQAYLQLDLSEAQMKESGMKALGQLKKDSPVEDVEKEVRTIIETYRTKSKAFLQLYESKQQLMRASFLNSDEKLTISQVEQLLAALQVRPVQRVPFYCMNGNQKQEIYTFGLRLARLFGFKFWAIDELKEEFKAQPDVGKYLAETKEDDIEGSFLVELIKRKMEKYNYKGKYLISGFPRSEKDVAALRVQFRNELTLMAYAGCLHTPTTQKQRESFESLYQFLATQEEIPSALINSTESSFAQITAHLRQVAPQPNIGEVKIVLFPTFEEEGSEHFKKMSEWIQIADFQEAIGNESRQQKFSSDLLSSCLALKRPVPSYIASNMFAEKVKQPGRQQLGSKPLVLKGFPQNIEQLKLVLALSETLKGLSCMFVQSSRIRKNIKSPNQADLAAYQKLCTALNAACDKCFKISEKSTYQEVKGYLDSL